MNRRAAAEVSKKYIEKAARDGRVAVCPEWMTEGKTVWFWRETFCDDELCLDEVGPSCPINSLRHVRAGDPEARRCARMHPVLESVEIWDVVARFDPRGVLWVINDGYEIRDSVLRGAVFPSRQSALAHRPEVIEYG